MTESTLPDLQTIQDAEARIRRHLPETPALTVTDLDTLIEGRLWLKLESLQRTGSFKVRGALNWVLSADEDELRNGLVTVSAGNHALALAWAAAQRKTHLTVVMPEGSSPLKIQRTEALGAEVIVRGKIQEAVAHCHKLRDEQGLTLVHPYNDPRVMAGQGTVGLELLRQCPDMKRVICPIGGGGLISGLGLALKAERPDVELIGAEPEGAATMRNAWDQNDADAALEKVDTWAASLAPAVVGNHTFAATRQVVDHIVTVSEAGIRQATRHLLSDAHLFVEPGASVGLAALLENKAAFTPEQTVLVITGANLDLDQVMRCTA
ncbi:threonine ammonia-lyase [Marinobacter nanhaiticus D15-8W]|uniref:Threonine/serine dehydratase n=1 Tax=Marinobacter nanhaiticus D15-8W TaxID=626887 RepID=N6W5K6_9GAMM|nr:threonine/serine dehydratase [Marinobacter nanhaiticus]ENO15499.1 threonine/serine dehydratase [Marinobacter nanhaiticus D15-8W]BES73652.1 threonine ammonia-lyase [Marinobacter nanhaiticus D15-8W]